MMYDSFLKNQPKVVKLIENSFKKNRLVHTYLFEGPRGTSKLEAAYYFANKLLCENSENTPCMKCEACKKVAKKVHPSIFYIEPENGMITKGQVEQLEREFSLTPLSEGRRVYIIDGIDKANISAANSLLKFFEELAGDNYGILITENLYAVISTIRSRSVIVHFDVLPALAIKNALLEKGIDEETSNVLSVVTNSVNDALALLEDEKVLNIIDLVKKFAISLVSEGSIPILVFYENEDILIKEKNKKYHNLFMDLLVTINHDNLHYILKNSDNIIFNETMEAISMNLTKTYEQILDDIDLLLKYKDRLRYNVNLEMFYSQLVIEMTR